MLSRRDFAAIAGAGTLSLLANGRLHGNTQTMTSPWLPLRGGVSLAGAEFGVDIPTFCNVAPGTHGRDYVYPSEQTIAYFASRGLRLLRVPFRWERLQPQLGEPLNAAELERLRKVANSAANCGALVILDMHNYGRYQLSIAGKPRGVIIDEQIGGEVPIPRAFFADVWQRLGRELAGTPGVAAFGLMNEPHDMGRSDWKAISQAAVTAIRSVDRAVYLLVAGYGWSNAHRFAEINGSRAWINDRSNRTAYEAHCYFDADATGKYRRSYADELRDDADLLYRGANRLNVFIQWCRQNRVPGMLGEFGIPGAEPGWRDVLAQMLKELIATNMSACYWAAGEWWHNYPLSIQPRDHFKLPAPQLAVLLEYLAMPSDA